MLLGPFGVIIIFIILVIASWLSQRLLGTFPDVGSKFVIAMGIQAFLDPFLICIVDVILQVCKYVDTLLLPEKSYNSLNLMILFNF